MAMLNYQRVYDIFGLSPGYYITLYHTVINHIIIHLLSYTDR